MLPTFERDKKVCVILVGNKTQILDLDLARAWEQNPHGAGIAYLEQGKVRTYKGLMTLGHTEAAIASVKTRGLLAVHFRLATHGAPTPRNTHPFRVGNGEALLHNGILSAFGKSGHGGASDSADLARILAKIAPADRAKILASLPGMFALVTPRARGGVALFGSKAWSEFKGVRASNLHWVTPAVRPVLDRRADWRLGLNDEDLEAAWKLI